MATPRIERLIGSSLPAHPWETVAVDLFELNGTSYLLVIGYFSKFPEVTSRISVAIIRAFKAYHLFFCSDNGPHFVSTNMKQFAKSYSFTQITSSPKYNGLVKRIVQTVKGLLSNSSDNHLVLLIQLPYHGAKFHLQNFS